MSFPPKSHRLQPPSQLAVQLSSFAQELSLRRHIHDLLTYVQAFSLPRMLGGLVLCLQDGSLTSVLHLKANFLTRKYSSRTELISVSPPQLTYLMLYNGYNCLNTSPSFSDAIGPTVKLNSTKNRPFSRAQINILSPKKLLMASFNI